MKEPGRRVRIDQYIYRAGVGMETAGQSSAGWFGGRWEGTWGSSRRLSRANWRERVCNLREQPGEKASRRQRGEATSRYWGICSEVQKRTVIDNKRKRRGAIDFLAWSNQRRRRLSTLTMPLLPQRGIVRQTKIQIRFSRWQGWINYRRGFCKGFVLARKLTPLRWMKAYADNKTHCSLSRQSEYSRPCLRDL